METTSTLIKICFLVSILAHGNGSTLKKIKIPDGEIIGRQVITAKKTIFFAFQDIPYASPPIGNLRLKEPVAPQKWKGVLNATENLKICPQFAATKVDPRENEDCLLLNVYTPAPAVLSKQNEKLPVLIWIHGGSFVSYSGAYDLWGPDFYIDKNIVVVTLNYRLGPLGFLSTQDGVIPDNLGLKDQQFALQWVNKNIEHFGGDPSKVTIGGQSAGAVSVGYHVLNNKTTGLFRAAIMESGSPLICWSLHKNARNIAYELGSNLKSDFNNSLSSQELLNIIKSATLEELRVATKNISINSNTMNCHLYTSLIWAPVVESGNQINALVQGMNHERLKNGYINKVPLLIGINSQESLLFGTLGPTVQCSIFEAYPDETITYNMNMKQENKIAAGKAIRNIYTNTSYSSNPANPINFASDCLFNTPIARHAVLQSSFSDVYFYQFSHVGTLGRYVYYDIEGANGLAHQEELGYFWANATTRDLSQYSEADVKVHEQAMDLWSQFIQNLDPISKTNKFLGTLKWPKVSKKSFYYLDIDLNMTVKMLPKKYEHWSRVFEAFADEELDTY